VLFYLQKKFFYGKSKLKKHAVIKNAMLKCLYCLIIFNQQRCLNMSRKEALESALKKIESQFGKGTIMKMNDCALQNIDCISTGSLGLDIALGIGGLPCGRIVEIY
jgi:hypothetical protein